MTVDSFSKDNQANVIKKKLSSSNIPYVSNCISSLNRIPERERKKMRNREEKEIVAFFIPDKTFDEENVSDWSVNIICLLITPTILMYYAFQLNKYNEKNENDIWFRCFIIVF